MLGKSRTGVIVVDDDLLWSGAAFHQPDEPGGVGQAELIDEELNLVWHKLFVDSITRRN